jgi:hypothetical protein
MFHLVSLPSLDFPITFIFSVAQKQQSRKGLHIDVEGVCEHIITKKRLQYTSPEYMGGKGGGGEYPRDLHK